MNFVDTSVRYAASVIEDREHTVSRELLLNAQTELLTTDYVIDELLTLLTARNHRDVALQIGNGFWTEQCCKLVWVSEEDVRDAWGIFASYRDKSWSFTDCVSYAVMRWLNIREALSLDDHFRQFGFLNLRP